ncbi:O-antigen ligase family protein [Natronomonas halophila]|uniref:O-antigen ligase family protein n=1 Tax=Natronomonas halophila TaxID=2747817 RepID=UPI0015B50BA1|nr:O-antigen ligase family protein [Natronomonas halophila]QLD86845.1 O-antigen ligase family protein [Natronomonas halophila]
MIFDVLYLFPGVSLSEPLSLLAGLLLVTDTLRQATQSTTKVRIRKQTMFVIVTFLPFIAFAVLRTEPFYSGYGAAISSGYLRKIAFASFVAIFVRRRRDLNVLLSYAVAAAVISAILTLHAENSRGTVLNINENLMGFSLVVGFVLLLALSIDITHDRRRYGLLGLSIPLIAGVIVSGSRGAYLVLAAVLCCSVAVFLYDDGLPTLAPRRLILGVVGVGAIVVAVFKMGDPAYYLERFGRLVYILDPDGNSSARSISIRLGLYRTGLRMFVERPLFGYGFGTFPEYAANHPPLFLRRGPHGLYISVLAQLGAVGVALLTAWILHLCRLVVNGYRGYEDLERRERIRFGVLGAGVVGVLVQGVAVDVLAWKPMWLIIGFILAQFELRKKNPTDDEFLN